MPSGPTLQKPRIKSSAFDGGSEAFRATFDTRFSDRDLDHWVAVQFGEDGSRAYRDERTPIGASRLLVLEQD